MKFILGIDPGWSGSISLLTDKNIFIKKMPETANEILQYFLKFKQSDCIAYLEKLHGRPGMGGTTMFSMGKNCGMIEVALCAANIKIVYISPQRWQKYFNFGTTRAACGNDSKWKNVLKAKAQQLFPKQNIFLWGADSALIAVYGKQMETMSK